MDNLIAPPGCRGVLVHSVDSDGSAFSHLCVSWDRRRGPACGGGILSRGALFRISLFPYGRGCGVEWRRTLAGYDRAKSRRAGNAKLAAVESTFLEGGATPPI